MGNSNIASSGLAKLAFLSLLLGHPIAALADESSTIEEVVARAPSKCGPWPIAHHISEGCEYQTLKTSFVDRVGAKRGPLLAACFSCMGDNCRVRHLVIDERRLCTLVFTTPKQILPLGVPRPLPRTPFDAKFSYSISSSGRVEDIILLESRGMSASRILALIREGALLVQYEPVTKDGNTITLTGVTSAYESQVLSPKN